MGKKGVSLRWGLLYIVAVCWILPILVVFGVSAYFLTNTYQGRVRETVSASVDNALASAQGRLIRAMDASRAVSYDRTVRSAYLAYRRSGDSVALYAEISEYLSAKYAYDDVFTAAFLYFTEDPATQYYVNNRSYAPTKVLQTFVEEALPTAEGLSRDLGTDIAFFSAGGRLYMVRNIVDITFTPYAVLVLQCSLEDLYESLYNIVWLQDATVWLDGVAFTLAGNGAEAGGAGIHYQPSTGLYTVRREIKVQDHILRAAVVCDGQNMLEDFPAVPTAALLALALPLLAYVIWAFYRHVSLPVNALVEAAGRVEAGELGYVVENLPSSLEFRYLTEHFNSMSIELKGQFDRSAQEQLALQDARIKALQSQINPHFLNNTLEIINWEARMANNTKVSGMIEALSTMLEAATVRDGRATVRLSEELRYVDAYLYIISERLGERLELVKQVDESLLDAAVPRLILQPIVENAVEHGVSLLPKGRLVLRAYRQGNELRLEVEQDGRMSQEDRETISRLLGPGAKDWEPQKGRLGIRNVNLRVKMLYGEGSGLTIEEIGPEKILARIRLPLSPEGGA